MATFQDLFTPVFIILSICIFIGGLVGIQVIDRLFAGSKNLNSIRMYSVSILINIIILLFLIMSFSKVKFQQGPTGPQGNKGDRGYQGKDGGLQICGKVYQTVEEKKNYEKSLKYLDTRPPKINFD